jgi:hypothetical protein
MPAMQMRDDFAQTIAGGTGSFACIEDPLVLCRTVAATAADAGGGGGSRRGGERNIQGRGRGRDSVNVTKNSSEEIVTLTHRGL